MVDVAKTCEPKSDQLNADDLISGPKTLEITGIKESKGEQPISIEYSGGDGRPWKPCKSMRRVLLKVWGRNGLGYIGKSVTVFCDPKVKWGGAEVGGIRISHMSGLKEEFKMMLTETKNNRSMYTVKPLVTEPLNSITDEEFDLLTAEINSADTMADLSPIGAKIKAARYDAAGAKRLKAIYSAAVERVRG
jgi:hypothetical protein